MQPILDRKLFGRGRKRPRISYALPAAFVLIVVPAALGFALTAEIAHSRLAGVAQAVTSDASTAIQQVGARLREFVGGATSTLAFRRPGSLAQPTAAPHPNSSLATAVVSLRDSTVAFGERLTSRVRLWLDNAFGFATGLTYDRAAESQGAGAALALATPPIAAAEQAPPVAAPIVQQTTSQPVIERVIETSVPLSLAGYVTQADLASQIASVKTNFGTTIYGSPFPTPASTPANGGIWGAIGMMGRIGSLDGTNLSNVTVDGVGGLTDSDIPDGITASNYLLLAGGSLSGDLTLSGTLTAGTLAVSGVSSGDAVEASYFTATSTSASSTFPNLNATNATTTNATSTSLFSTLGRFTTGVFSTLLTAAVATIDSLTSTTLVAVNATTTRLDALDYVAVGRTATTTIRGDGVASTIPYASTTAITASDSAYFPGSGIWNSSGNVGIGTTSPMSKLSVVNDGSVLTLARNTTQYGEFVNSSSGFLFRTYSSPSNAKALNINATTDTADTAPSAGGTYITFNVLGTEYLRLGSATSKSYFTGNVGFGTTSPYAKLSITNVGSDPSLLIEDSTSPDSTPFIVDASGNVGIGTSDPDAPLSFDNVTGAKINLYDSLNYDIGIQSNLMEFIVPTSGADFAFGYGSSGSLTRLLTIDGGGNIGIASTTPWRTLSVVGTAAINGLTSSATGNYVCINTTTWELTRGNGSACTTSSLRFKENIADLSYGLDAVEAMRPVSFNYKPEMNMGTTTHVGFIAEEMQKLVPEVVNLDEAGQPSGIDYPSLTAVLAKAVQELAQRFTDLTRTVANFAESFTTRELTFERAQGGRLSVETLCVEDVCVTRDQFLRMVEESGGAHSSASTSAPQSSEPNATSTIATPGGQMRSDELTADLPEEDAPTTDFEDDLPLLPLDEVVDVAAADSAPTDEAAPLTE